MKEQLLKNLLEVKKTLEKLVKIKLNAKEYMVNKLLVVHTLLKKNMT